MHGMQQRVVGLFLLSLICGHCVFAQESVSVVKPDLSPSFPHSGYRPLPPHFQPRRVIATNPEQVSVAPPSLPSYEQPTIPAQGYLWVPGFWAWRKSVSDYFWVPGTWVRPPETGLLWTPPYWSRVEGGYAFHAGYWAAEVGFYGGIAYGFGYTGKDYQGGRWENGEFSYDRAFNNLGSVHITSAYGQTSAADENSSHVSYNGGRRGVPVGPSPHQQELINIRHVEATAEHQRHFELAAMDRSLYSKLNNGEPAVAATQRAGVLAGAGIMPSRRRSDQTARRDGESSEGARSAVAPPSDQADQPASK
jgi:WXXGXW repeat (2 copies)